MPDTYRLTDLPQVGGIKTMLQRISAKLTALENSQDTTAFHALAVSGNTVNFYVTTDTTTTPAYSFDFPVDKFLDQVRTNIVENFAWSSTTYPNSTNPNLDGNTVLVFAVKDNGATPTIEYSFLSLERLIDVYTAGDNSITISGYNVSVKINPDAANLLSVTATGLMVDGSGKVDKVSSATAGNVPLLTNDGGLTNSTIIGANVLVKLTGGTTGDILTLGSDGGIVDSTVKIATDAEFTEMLNEVMPVSGS